MIRSDRILAKTTDESLTSNLVEAEKITLDQAAAHEERNNLYSFLGERGTPKIQISKKRKLENGDVFLLLTRGVWEQCPDEKLLEIIRDANEPEEVLYRTEDWILERQETAEIDNYTMAVTFVRKVYQSPKKPWTLKKILMVVIPVVLVVGGISIALFLGHRSIQNKEKELAECMEDGETYFQNDNYQRAVEEYGEAEELADSLKREEEALLADQYKQVAEQIILADETLAAGEYEKAQELYLTAGEMSQKAGNVGKDYIDSQLERAKDYIAVYDLIALGERKEEYGNLEGAVAAYKEAREKAADIYYSEGKTEALEKQAAAEEAMEKAAMEEAARKKEQEEKDCQEEMGSCMVYVCGAVENPGVYELPEKSRVYEAVAMAGGMTEDAGMEAVNQAEFVTDGQMLRIPTMEEVAAAQEESESNVDDGLLDINRASVADFMTLPGIGQSKAEALFQYREAHGRFSSIEEIMNVDGIKEGVFNKIKDSIKV